jgi:hypothetical protein
VRSKVSNNKPGSRLSKRDSNRRVSKPSKAAAVISHAHLKAPPIAVAQANWAGLATEVGPVAVAARLRASTVAAVQLALRVNADKRAVEVAEGDRAVAVDAAGNGIVSDHSKRRSS